jgi:hypothetical protein
MKKYSKEDLDRVSIITTQEKIAPSKDMPPANLDGVKMITPATTLATPAAVVEPVVAVLAPPVTPDVKLEATPSNASGTPSASSDGTPAVTPSANASTDDNDSELKEDELPEGIRKRFSKLTNKRKEAETRAKELEEAQTKSKLDLEVTRRELEFYRDLQLNSKPAHSTTVAPVAPAAPAAPVEKELIFSDYAAEADPISAFVDAKVNSIVSKRLAPVEKALDPATAAHQKQLDAIKAEFPDYTQVVQPNSAVIMMLSENPITDKMIPASKDRVKLTYYLSKHPDEARKLADMTDPIDVGVALREIQNKLVPQKTAESSKQIEVPTPAALVQKPIEQTKAPEPFTPVNPAGSPGLPPIEELTPDQLRNDPRYSRLFKRR